MSHADTVNLLHGLWPNGLAMRLSPEARSGPCRKTLAHVLEVSHSQMLFLREVVRQAGAFLEHGNFDRTGSFAA